MSWLVRRVPGSPGTRRASNRVRVLDRRVLDRRVLARRVHPRPAGQTPALRSARGQQALEAVEAAAPAAAVGVAGGHVVVVALLEHDARRGSLCDEVDADDGNALVGQGGSVRHPLPRVDEPARRVDLEVFADDAAGRVRASVTTAIALSDADREKLGRELSAQLGKDVRLVAKVDPAILGGLVLQVGDRLTDGSVAGRLDQLRRKVLVQ